MTAIYAITELIKKVEDERRELITELKVLEKSDTFFRKFTYSRIACRAKIELLNKVNKWLKEELRRTILMDNMEL